MCVNEFFLHEWEPEAMRQIVEGRKAYNREQERLEDEQRKQEIELLIVKKEKLLQEEEKIQEETIKNTIVSMLKNKIDYKTISKVTNKTVEEIKKIEKQQEK